MRMPVSVSLPRLGGWRGAGIGSLKIEEVVSVSLPRLGGWRVGRVPSFGASIQFVSVSLPRLGGWRAQLTAISQRPSQCFSLVAEIGWLASQPLCRRGATAPPVSVSLPRLGGWRVPLFGPSALPMAFQSRCRDWVVGELPWAVNLFNFEAFQSRCRDWVVGEVGGTK